MKQGYLSEYFESVAAKKLSSVEINLARSHQHEFNGSRELKQVLKTTEKTKFPTKFLWIEDQNETLSDEGLVTWYDAREHHETRSEYRLYFPSNSVIQIAKEGDTMFIAKRTDGTLLIVMTSSGSTIENQLYWLFGITNPPDKNFELSEIDKSQDHEIDFAARFILDELGVEIEEAETDKLDQLLSKFSNKFPTTLEFSQFARETITSPINAVEDPDGALIACMDWEEKLFRRLERHIVSLRLTEGFTTKDEADVDGFIKFSLSVQNRRKSRAGYALEEHLSFIFKQNGIYFSIRKETENKSKPDFIFPDIKFYHSSSYPEVFLNMLGAKTSCKDRWRQVLSEATRIKEKHLLTLEPSISENQTNEMQAHQLQLVLPKNLHETYTSTQQRWLINLEDFIKFILDIQGKAHMEGYLEANTKNGI